MIKIITAAASEISASPNTLAFRASDESIDRDREIIRQSGWELDNFRKNPLLLNSHGWYDIRNTLARITNIRVEGNQLLAEAKFAVEENPLANLAYKLYKGGYLNCYSVSFLPLATERPGPELANVRLIYTKQELLEISAVTVPSNPNAVSLAAKSGTITENDLLTALAALESGDCLHNLNPNRNPNLRSEANPFAHREETTRALWTRIDQAIQALRTL
jgi:HK97 family phage prohead protease